jgi:hypothetical protein
MPDAARGNLIPAAGDFTPDTAHRKPNLLPATAPDTAYDAREVEVGSDEVVDARDDLDALAVLAVEHVEEAVVLLLVLGQWCVMYETVYAAMRNNDAGRSRPAGRGEKTGAPRQRSGAAPARSRPGTAPDAMIPVAG